MNNYLTVALAKGRLAELSAQLFEGIGLGNPLVRAQGGRKLIIDDPERLLRFMLVKASDVPTYVEYGAADIGIVGRDTLLEDGKQLYEMLDLRFGACRMCVCGWEGKPLPAGPLRVATKYPNIARDYFFNQKKQTVEIIRLSGSVELAPLCGLSDVIVDIVESGRTLQENGLGVLEEIHPLSARLAVNRASLKMRRERIMGLVEKMKEHIA